MFVRFRSNEYSFDTIVYCGLPTLNSGLTQAETARGKPFESSDDTGSKATPPSNPARTDIDGQTMTHNGRNWSWSEDDQWWIDKGPAG